jgi:hypothetical protein
MPKRWFTQSACILLAKATSLDEIIPLLSAFNIVGRHDEVTDIHLGGPRLILSFRPEVNGYVQVNVRNIKWPDHMGDPKIEPMLMGAWAMGHYGPFTFPGSLARAREQLWGWPGGKDVADRHEAVIQICTSYIFGCDKEFRFMSADYDALPEIQFVTRIALALLKHPDALAYFNPNAEVLTSEKLLRESLEHYEQQKVPPLNIWAGVRLLNPKNGWLIMDTMGMEQLDRPDVEACFPAETYDCKEVSGFLLNCALYLLENCEVIQDQDTIDGPGGIRWQAHHVTKELFAPPRRLLRFFPVDGSKPPKAMCA